MLFKKTAVLAALALALAPMLALAQSSPAFQAHQVLSSSALNSAFQNKADTTNGVLVTPNLGVPSSVVLTNGTGLPVSTGLSGLGTGVAAALGQNASGSGAICLTTGCAMTTPNLGTPAAVNLTNGTGLPLTSGVTGVLPLTSGGTGSNTQNFVDLTTNQTVSGTKTFSGQLIGKGTATNDNAAAGYFGEFVCAQTWNGGSPAGCQSNASTAVSIAAGATANLASLSLTAGDWRVCATAAFSPLGTSTTAVGGAISLTSGTFPSSSTPSSNSVGTSIGASFNGNFQSFAVGCVRESLSATTTIYLVGTLAGTGTNGLGWGIIEAWRGR